MISATEPASAHEPAPAKSPALGQDVHTISLVSIVHMGSHFAQLMLPPLFPWIGVAFGLSNTQLGALVSVLFVVSGFGQALAGFVVDRHGADRVLFGGLALLALGALGLGTSPNYAAMIVSVALVGLGNCVFHPVDYSILNHRVGATRLGSAYAAHGISGSLGWAVAPAFMVGLAALSSWRWALVGAATLLAALLGLAIWQRAAFRMARAVANAEEISKAADTAAGAKAASPATGAAAGRPAADRTLAFLRLPAVWACFLFFMIFAAALGGMQTFAPAAAGHLHGISAEQMALSLSIFMVAGAAGMVLGGQLVRDPRRSARVAAAGFGTAASIALVVGLWRWPPAMLPVLIGAMGFVAGIAGPSRDLLVKQATPPGATGRVFGVVYSGLDVGLTLTPLIFGALMDAGRYREVWLGVALLYALLIASIVNVRSAAAPARPAPAAAG